MYNLIFFDVCNLRRGSNLVDDTGSETARIAGERTIVDVSDAR